MKPIIPYIKEKFMGQQAPNSIVKVKGHSIYETNDSEYELTNKDYIRYFEQVPQLQNAITSTAEMITGTQITINTDDEKAKLLIEKWNNDTKFFDKFRGIVYTTLICGKSLLEKLDEKKTLDVLEVDMRTITGKVRDKFGKTTHYEQDNLTNSFGEKNKLPVEKFIEFEFQNISRGKWGIPPYHALAIPRRVGDRVMMSVLDCLVTAEDAMTSIINNHADPLEFFIFEGMNDDDLQKEAKKIEKRKPGDKYIGTRKPEHVISETKGDSKYEGYINHMDKTVQIGEQFPTDIMTGDFTSRASSDTTLDLTKIKIMAQKRYYAAKLKNELYDPILKQNGINPDTANLQVSFSTDDIIDLDAPSVLSLKNSGVITLNEHREWLKQNTSLDLFEDKEIAQQAEDKKKEDEDKPFFQKEKRIMKCGLCKENQHALCTQKRCKCDHSMPDVSEQDLIRMRKKLILKLAEREGIETKDIS